MKTADCRAFWRVQVQLMTKNLRQAKQDLSDAKHSFSHYNGWLKSSGNAEVWGDDARRSRKELAAAKKDLSGAKLALNYAKRMASS